MRPPTGQQCTISRTVDGRQLRATITEVAAGLRELTVDGVDLVEPFPEDGRPAMPWRGLTVTVSRPPA